MNSVEQFIENQYSKALASNMVADFETLPVSLRGYLDYVADNADGNKGVLAVVMTSLVYKSLHPHQDVRCHQQSIEGGYSGRTFDTHYITPFLREKSFPNMASSGWLTRSLEQKHPYTQSYPGAITPEKMKIAFLGILDIIQNQDINLCDAVKYLFAKLIAIRDSRRVEIAKPKNLSIETIIDVLIRHFNHDYAGRGASRLPVLAFYAVYMVLLKEIKRYNGKMLLPLESHTSADSQSGRLGDIDVVDGNGNSFEAVEVKSGIPVTYDIVERAKEKILPSHVVRYYILSTKPVRKGDEAAISDVVAQVKNTHGCQIVVNGIIPSLKYYLRLLENPTSFIENYAGLLSSDTNVKFEHRKVWNEIIGNL